eukprot:6173477-Pleurochrysis_carterae.AAC.2
MGLRAILGCSTGSSRLCNSSLNLFMYIRYYGIVPNTLRICLYCLVAFLHSRSALICVCGWTMMYKFGHHVATLFSDGGDYTSLSRNSVNSADQTALGMAGLVRA